LLGEGFGANSFRVAPPDNCVLSGVNQAASINKVLIQVYKKKGLSRHLPLSPLKNAANRDKLK
jgi:hypothetical protein